MKVTRSAPYIAETRGTRSFPWRVLAIAETDGDLILNQLVYLLSDPCRLEDASWIRPGKAAWDYWSALNVYGVDFPAGINTDTYRYFIDFASDYGIEYIILDEGWYADGDLLSVTPSIDMEALMAHARKKNVGVILWVTWKALEDQLTPALDRFQRWGVAGIKVDYMQRDDQWMVNYYWKIAREAANRRMIVDFHGCYKPAGLRRAYPNVLTREGVQGLEQCKVTDTLTPEHNLTIPFIRMVAGPMDYTPGAMINAQKENFKPIFKQPMSLSTRCHQLAMFVVYESPLQMLADSPSNYRREPECMEFLRRVPTVWDETVVLHARIGDCLALARRSGDEWYVGAMAGETPRDLTLDFSFLDPGRYKIDFYQDGVNAERNASDFRFDTARINRDSRMTIHLARGGGWAARIYR
jgi:alpha-glucosidase